MTFDEIDGFLKKPKLTAKGRARPGRFTCHDVQWTGTGPEALATFTITAEELAEASESRLLWTDQDVQRGIQPGIEPSPDRELPLGDGYPNKKQYIFDADKADDIAEKLLRGDRLFLTPLVWNLRPGSFEAFWDSDKSLLRIYDGKIYLPDSHHRQQAIQKAVQIYRDAPSEYRKFTLEKQFKIELYFLSKEDEGNYFFDKNQRPKPTAKSKAYDLTTQDDLSLLAKKVIDKSTALKNNVNRVTDRLTAKNPQVVTLSTLREMMRSVAQDDALDEVEIEGLATVAATFYDLIAEVRPELGHLEAAQRRECKANSLVGSAVMMHGYAALMREFNNSISEIGIRRASSDWKRRLSRLSASRAYRFDAWAGDLFEKRNPLWQMLGVVKPGRDGRRLTILNTGAARSICGRVLGQLLSVDREVRSLKFLLR